jgi:hypothetical protein
MPKQVSQNLDSCFQLSIKFALINIAEFTSIFTYFCLSNPLLRLESISPVSEWFLPFYQYQPWNNFNFD